MVGSAFFANAFGYVFHFVLSRKLGPDGYGTLATLIAISGIVGVLGSALSTVGMQETARMWSSHLDSHISPFVRQTTRYVVGIGLVVAVLLLLVTLAMRAYLHVLNIDLWVLLAAYVAIAVVETFVRGTAQGAHRFWVFAASVSTEGVLKVVLAVAFVLAGFSVAGGLGGLLCAAAVGLAIAFVPMSSGAGDTLPVEHVRLGGEAIKILAVNTAAAALLFIDMIFAKHHFAGDQAGFFGAAGTVAKTIPYGVGFVSLILMPTAAAARHRNRPALRHFLLVAASWATVVIVAALALISLLPTQLISITYGPHYSGAIPILRLYSVNEALLALWVVATSFLIAIGEYALFYFLAAGVLAEAVCMAAFGSTPQRLLEIAIVVNALLVPTTWGLALRAVRAQPQAANPVAAEALTEPLA